MAGIVAPLAGGIGDRDHDPLARALRIFAQLYRVVVALRHLPAIEAEDLRRVGQIGMRLDQDRLSLLAVEVVEAAHELAGQLEVRDLVLPNGHGIGAIDGDVGGLQDRISEEAIVVEVLVAELLLLLLVGRDPLEPADGRDHPEEQEELGVLLHLALDEEDVLLRVEAGGDPVGEHLPLGRGDPGGVLVVARQRVPVGGEEEALARDAGSSDPAAQRSVVVPEVHAAGRPHPAHHRW